MAILYSVHCKWLAIYCRYEYNQCLPFWSYKFFEAWVPFAVSPFLLLTEIAKRVWGMENVEIIVKCIALMKENFYVSGFLYITDSCLIYTWLTVYIIVLWFYFSFIWHLTNIIIFSLFPWWPYFSNKTLGSGIRQNIFGPILPLKSIFRFLLWDCDRLEYWDIFLFMGWWVI